MRLAEGEVKYMIRRAMKEDAQILAELAIQMWDDNTLEGLTAEFEELLGEENATCFLAYKNEEATLADGRTESKAGGTAKHKAVGFAQCQLRFDYVEGTETSPVGYLEGIFVEEAYRYAGIASALLQECQRWAKEKGCAEFASDCELDNIDSFEFHLALGFEEAGRVICFRKEL